jgi:hypothetical protein
VGKKIKMLLEIVGNYQLSTIKTVTFNILFYCFLRRKLIPKMKILKDNQYFVYVRYITTLVKKINY